MGSSILDNASQGGIFCGIDEEGKLKKYALRYNGDRFETHPTSGVRFEGYQLPSFPESMDLVRRAHPYMPQSRLIA